MIRLIHSQRPWETVECSMSQNVAMGQDRPIPAVRPASRSFPNRVENKN